MEFKEIVEARRTHKDFETNHSIDDNELEYIINAARKSPTSFNIQNWRFVAIRDRGLKEKIKRVSYDQHQIAINSILIAVCADINAWNENPKRYWTSSDIKTASDMANQTKNFYGNNPQLQRDEAMRSIGLSSMAIMYAATDLGYSSNPIIGFDVDAVAQIINLPENHVIGMLIAIGIDHTPPAPKTLLPVTEILIYDFFPSD